MQYGDEHLCPILQMPYFSQAFALVGKSRSCKGTDLMFITLWQL